MESDPAAEIRSAQPLRGLPWATGPAAALLLRQYVQQAYSNETLAAGTTCVSSRLNLNINTAASQPLCRCVADTQQSGRVYFCVRTILRLSNASRPALRPAQPPTQWAAGSPPPPVV
jgi:hypothetical protein